MEESKTKLEEERTKLKSQTTKLASDLSEYCVCTLPLYLLQSNNLAILTKLMDIINKRGIITIVIRISMGTELLFVMQHAMLVVWSAKHFA